MNRAFATSIVVLAACTAPPPSPSIGQASQAEKEKHGGYRFSRVATLGDPDPGGPPGSTLALASDGGYFFPMGINNEGQVLYDALVDTTWVEGMFTWKKGVSHPIVRGGDPAPGATTLSGWGALNHCAMDDDGNIFLPWVLDPFQYPIGTGDGAWFYDAERKALSAVAVAGVTHVPGSNDTFVGVDIDVAMNQHRDKVFTGQVPFQGQNLGPVGLGVFRSDRHGNLSAVVAPGDSAPGGKRFDQAWHGFINDDGAVAFGAHIEGEECVTLDPTFHYTWHCYESVYLRDHSGNVTAIAHQGDPAPGGGTYRFAWGANLNHDGDILFVGDLSTPPDAFVSSGMFLYHNGSATRIASPGDLMPGGGTWVAGPDGIYLYHLADSGEAVFHAYLDDGEGIYSYRHGQTTLVARTGSVLPGLGVVDSFPYPSGAYVNDDGDVIFQAQLDSGDTTLLVARR